MALPQGILSPTVEWAGFREPRDVPKSALEAFERGGIAVGDTSRGLDHQNWTAVCDGTDVTLTPDSGVGTVIYSGVNITEIDLAFDQSMNPYLALVEDGLPRLWYFDTLSASYQHLNVPGAATPRCTLDDHEQFDSAKNDVLFFYLLNGNLVMRVQRERFDTAHVLASGQDYQTLVKVGMGENRRLHFLLS